MITRKYNVISTTASWPYTPEPSPPLGPTTIQIPVDEHFKMPDDGSRLRPVSMISRREGFLSPSGRPTLDDVLNNRAPSPYTLAAYTAFLSQQHCLETLEFVTEAKKYGAKYDEAVVSFAGMPFTTETDEGFELAQDWCRLLDVYVKPGAPREINLPAEERDDLVDVSYEPRPPLPEALDPAVKRMYDLMSDSIFIPFCNSMKAVSPSALMNASPTLRALDAEDYHHSMSGRDSHSRKTSPPTTVPNSQRLNPTSNPARTSSPRLSMHISHSSAASETAVSDQSSAYSPVGGELDMTSPPLTPPRSAVPPASHAPTHGPYRTQRHESGGWKKLGKLFGNKKK